MLAHGHKVTTFNRGRSDTNLYPELEKIHGNREEDLSALEGRRWDAVIDTCGYIPAVVRKSAQLLSGKVGVYTFISSISAYARLDHQGVNESDITGTLSPEEVAEVKSPTQITGENYGPLKALCEQEVLEAFPAGSLIIRPGLIVGPHDPTGRFTYWPRRVAQGGEVLAPGNPGLPVQFIDARDLSDWTVRLVEQGQTGIYNATGPNYPVTLGQLLEECQRTLNSEATFTWVEDEFLLQNEVTPWMGLPLWIPSSDPSAVAMGTVNCSKAFATGLTFRPLPETIRDTRMWEAALPEDAPRGAAGITREKESALLEAWKAR
jgi:2'-hydroxyisoflavone reductase